MLTIRIITRKEEHMAQDKQHVAPENRNLLLNIRDTVGILAIIVLIPILSYRAAGVFIDWRGLSTTYREQQEEIEQLANRERNITEQLEYYLHTQKQRKDVNISEIADKTDSGQQTLQTIIKEENMSESEKEQIKTTFSQLQEVRSERQQKKRNLDTTNLKIFQHRFYTSLGVGLIALLVGIFIPLFHVGIGFLFGGIITLSYGYYIYWDFMSDLLATISIIAALAILTYGIWFYRPQRA